MKRTIVAMFLAASIGVTAAAEVGNKFEIELADSFEQGVTTLEVAKEQFGSPASVSTDAEGNQTLWWKYARVSTFSGRDVRKLAIVFDKDGKMLRVAHREVLK